MSRASSTTWLPSFATRRMRPSTVDTKSASPSVPTPVADPISFGATGVVTPPAFATRESPPGSFGPVRVVKKTDVSSTTTEDGAACPVTMGAQSPEPFAAR